MSQKNTKVPAFPGAEGAGKFSAGGRGGRIIEITNLDNSGPGSLRAAVEAEGPRIVVFRVSGNIELKSDLVIVNPYITIAGQTAPGDGICLTNRQLIVKACHTVIRYIRVRPGDNAGATLDALTVAKGANVIIDHCSTSWAVDETLSVGPDEGPGAPTPDKVTVQWCIISESLNKSVHPKGEHGYGTLAKGAWGSQYTFHHNLYAHHKARSPYPSNYNDISVDPNGLTFDFRNNVIYNWGNGSAGYNTQAKAESVTKMNFVNNYYKQGPNSGYDRIFFQRERTSKGYFSGNWLNGVCPADQWSIVRFDDKWTEADIAAYKQSKELPVDEPVPTEDAQKAYEKVLADAGASLPVRDPVDKRIVDDVRNGTGRIIDDEDDVGSWPELKAASAPADSDHDGMSDKWELANGLDPNDAGDSAKDRDGDGYTNIEEYINSLCR